MKQFYIQLNLQSIIRNYILLKDEIFDTVPSQSIEMAKTIYLYLLKTEDILFKIKKKKN